MSSYTNNSQIIDLITDETGMTPFIDALVVAHKLQIPHASFGKFMVRKLLPLARDHLVDLETVGRAYDSGDEVFNELDIREVCVKSIFEHWFAWKLDGDEEWKIDYMCTLAEMREHMKDLDADLHKAVEDKNQWLKDMKKKRREQDQQNSEEAGADGGNDGWGDKNAGAAADGGDTAWANQDTVISGESADWMNNNAGAGGVTGEWAAEGDAVPTNGANDWAGGTNKIAEREPVGGDWADDMNAHASDQGAQSFNPVPIAAGGGW